jgi:hypothetical protein
LNNELDHGQAEVLAALADLGKPIDVDPAALAAKLAERDHTRQAARRQIQPIAAHQTVLQGHPPGQGWRQDTGYLDDPDILRPSELQHPVQGRGGDGDFRGFSLVSPRS